LGAEIVPKLRSASGFRELGTLFSVGVIGGLSDRQLVERFMSRRGEAKDDWLISKLWLFLSPMEKR
jgi:hypothetical protein